MLHVHMQPFTDQPLKLVTIVHACDPAAGSMMHGPHGNSGCCLQANGCSERRPAPNT